jgi:phosphoribosylaminoimidazole-succinocarboxamide synthase
MIKGAEVFEGPDRRLFRTDDQEVLIYEFRGGAAPRDGEEIAPVPSKPERNLKIAALIFRLLESNGLRTYFIREDGGRAMDVRTTKYFPLLVTCRNAAAGRFAAKLGMPDGEALPMPVIEFLIDKRPMNMRPSAGVFTEITEGDAKLMQSKMIAANNILRSFFKARGLVLADFAVEFGRDAEGYTLICGAITPDTCRLWLRDVHEKIDRDRFRRTLRGTEADYIDVLHRITANV